MLFFFSINDFVFHCMFIFGSFPQMQYYVFCMFSFHPFFEYTPSAKTSLGCSVLYHSQSIHFSFVLFNYVFSLFLIVVYFLFWVHMFLVITSPNPKRGHLLVLGILSCFQLERCSKWGSLFHDQPLNVIIPYHFSVNFGAEFPVCLN